MSDDIREVVSTLVREFVLAPSHPLKEGVQEKDALLLRGIPFVNFKHARFISHMLTQNRVSVGSGDGAIEKLLFKKKVICVDPNPGFEKRVDFFIKPEFDFTSSLVAANPSVVSDCSLWLFWPNPACCFCSVGICDKSKMHHEEYDFEAIQLLKPKMITMLVSLDENASGSKKLGAWVKNWRKSGYELIFSCNSMGVSVFEMKLYPFILTTQFFCFVKKEFYLGAFKTIFSDSRSTFYTVEEYWRIRKSMDPEKLVFSPKEKQILRAASTEMLINPVSSSSKPTHSKPSTGIPFHEPIHPLIPKEKKDDGFYFHFD